MRTGRSADERLPQPEDGQRLDGGKMLCAAIVEPSLLQTTDRALLGQRPRSEDLHTAGMTALIVLAEVDYEWKS